MKKSDYQDHMAYALGYYHGRVNGYESRPEFYKDAEKFWYGEGYQRGVSDYCELDEETNQEQTK